MRTAPASFFVLDTPRFVLLSDRFIARRSHRGSGWAGRADPDSRGRRVALTGIRPSQPCRPRRQTGVIDESDVLLNVHDDPAPDPQRLGSVIRSCARWLRGPAHSGE